MKLLLKLFILIFVSLVFIPAMFSCAALPKGWSGLSVDERRPVISLGSVTANRSSHWSSIEDEIRRMAVIIGLENHCAITEENSDTAWLMDIWAVEREFLVGWKNRRSLSLEVFIYEKERRTVPFAAGRVFSQGSRTIAVSAKLNGMLRMALKKALRIWDRDTGRGGKS